MSVAVIVNRRARGLTGETKASRALLDVLRAPTAGVRRVETRSLAELDAAADELARDAPDAVLLAGGDGSYMAGVSALVRAFTAAGRAPGDLPPIALVPGGTACTVARNWGFRGGGLLATGSAEGAARYTARLLRAAVEGRAREVRRPTLLCADDRASRVGFIVGAGLVAQFFTLYDAEGAPGYRGAARLVLRVFLGSMTGGALAQRVLTPVPCLLSVDGARAPFERASLVCASVVRDLGLGMRLLHRAAEETTRFHVVATPLEPSRLGPQLPLVLAGRPLLGSRNVDALATTLELRFGAAGAEAEGAYVLDGELLRATFLRVTAGPVLRTLSV